MGSTPSNTAHCNFTDELPKDEPEEKCWMARIEDETPFTKISIPGTHYSCSSYLRSAKWQHQSLDVSRALRAGIRYFHVPMKLEKDSKLVLWQDYYPIGKDFAVFLEPIVYFLTMNKSEVLIVCLVEACASEGDKQFSDVVCEEILKGVLSELIWMDCVLPECLGDARGRIIFLRDYSDGEARLVPFQNAVYSNQSGLPNNYELFWKKARKELIKTVNDKEKLALHVTYVSHKDFYYSAANVINRKLFDFLQNCRLQGDWGVIAMDFPGSKLIRLIILANRIGVWRRRARPSHQLAIEWSTPKK